jgi:hypothetical protein
MNRERSRTKNDAHSLKGIFFKVRASARTPTARDNVMNLRMGFSHVAIGTKGYICVASPIAALTFHRHGNAFALDLASNSSAGDSP